MIGRGIIVSRARCLDDDRSPDAVPVLADARRIRFRRSSLPMSEASSTTTGSRVDRDSAAPAIWATAAAVKGAMVGHWRVLTPDGREISGERCFTRWQPV